MKILAFLVTLDLTIFDRYCRWTLNRSPELDSSFLAFVFSLGE